MADPRESAAPGATKAETMSGGGAETPRGRRRAVACKGKGSDFALGDGVSWGAMVRPYERGPGDPLYRPLRIFTLDPVTSQLEGAVAEVKVPYEPLQPGPCGSLFRVSPVNLDTRRRYVEADLDDPAVLIRDGYDPSPADPRFHAQMVYAVASLTYDVFRHALGRYVPWGFEQPREDKVYGATRLGLNPFGGVAHNAIYEPKEKRVRFGFYEVEGTVAGRNVPKGIVFTSLSHDVVVHELTHALLDGLRSRFLLSGTTESLAFHEGFADLVAIFQHFSYPAVVRAAIRESRGQLRRADLLISMAMQFGQTNEHDGQPLRIAIDVDDRGQLAPRHFDPTMEAHVMGGVLVSAVFSAFLTVYDRKTERYVRLATGGSGELPKGELSEDLQAVLAEEASKLASQFLNVCIRAIDYCPPVDLRLGDYLRALVTADYDLVRDDPWCYREALIASFAEHGIFPENVRSLAEDELRWKAPEREIPPIEKLSFAELRFEGDPARPASEGEMERQACALGAVIAGNRDQFGVTVEGDPNLGNATVGLPTVASIRAARRVGPDGQVVFDLVAEVTQTLTVTDPDLGEFDVFGGATVILGPSGEVRYLIAKKVLNDLRRARQKAFLESDEGKRYWMQDASSGKWVQKNDTYRLLHESNGRGAAATAAPPAEGAAPPQ